MTTLTICNADNSGKTEVLREFNAIAAKLKSIGVQFEKWQANKILAKDADQAAVLEAYQESVDKLNKQYGFKSIDVVSLLPDNPKKEEFRQKFLAEHTHADFEVRFFVDGSGLFYLHVNGKVYMVVCEKGDLISVPANTTHWFDMGEKPYFKCIRFFTTPEGWLGNFTGNDIATKFPSFDQHLSAVA